MLKCLTCGVEDENVTWCKRCGETFCAECGDTDANLCLYCLESYDSFNDQQRRFAEVAYSKYVYS